MADKSLFIPGTRVVTKCKLTNGPAGPEKGERGIVTTRTEGGGRFFHVNYSNWTDGRPQGDTGWFTFPEDIELTFDVYDRVCLSGNIGDTGTIYYISDDKDEAEPYLVSWDDGTADETSFSANELRPLIQNNMPVTYTPYVVGERATIRLNADFESDHPFDTGTRVKITKVDLNERLIYEVQEVDGTRTAWVRVCDLNHPTIPKIGQKEDEVVKDPKPSNRIPVDSKVEIIAGCSDRLIESGLKVGDTATLIRDDRTSLPYEIRMDEDDKIIWVRPNDIRVVSKSTETPAVKTVELKPYSAASALAGLISAIDYSSTLSVGGFVITTADLEYKVKKNTVGTVISGPDADGDYEVSWTFFVEGNAGSTGQEDRKDITFVGPSDMGSIKKISREEAEVEEKKFRKGDWIELTRDYENAKAGMKGIMASNDGELVRFPGWDGGHDGGQVSGSKEFYYVNRSRMKKIDPPASDDQDTEQKAKAKAPVIKPGMWVEATKDISTRIKKGSRGQVSEKYVEELDEACVFWDDLTNGHHGDGSRGSVLSGWHVPIDHLKQTFGPGEVSLHIPV